MGTPVHFSSELPERCLLLIDKLLPQVRETFVPGERDLGPLTTTFLYAMAMPIITLPMERVKRHRERAKKGEEGYMDDRALSPDLAAAVDEALGAQPLSKAPFYRADHWRFFEHDYQDGMNLANGFPHDAERGLQSEDAAVAAANMPAEHWAQCLRNALAHGGATYLDKHGHYTRGANAAMIAFSSAKYPGGNPTLPPERLRHLRINETHFLDFIWLWVGWLHHSKLSLDLVA
jgi:hypothetical protein